MFQRLRQHQLRGAKKDERCQRQDGSTERYPHQMRYKFHDFPRANCGVLSGRALTT